MLPTRSRSTCQPVRTTPPRPDLVAPTPSRSLRGRRRSSAICTSLSRRGRSTGTTFPTGILATTNPSNNGLRRRSRASRSRSSTTPTRRSRRRSLRLRMRLRRVWCTACRRVLRMRCIRGISGMGRRRRWAHRVWIIGTRSRVRTRSALRLPGMARRVARRIRL
jgi:hypothetical protein